MELSIKWKLACWASRWQGMTMNFILKNDSLQKKTAVKQPCLCLLSTWNMPLITSKWYRCYLQIWSRPSIRLWWASSKTFIFGNILSNATSEWIKIKRGRLYGASLGPSLWNFYQNDMSSHVNDSMNHVCWWSSNERYRNGLWNSTMQIKNLWPTSIILVLK